MCSFVGSAAAALFKIRNCGVDRAGFSFHIHTKNYQAVRMFNTTDEVLFNFIKRQSKFQ